MKLNLRIIYMQVEVNFKDMALRHNKKQTQNQQNIIYA